MRCTPLLPHSVPICNHKVTVRMDRPREGTPEPQVPGRWPLSQHQQPSSARLFVNIRKINFYWFGASENLNFLELPMQAFFFKQFPAPSTLMSVNILAVFQITLQCNHLLHFRFGYLFIRIHPLLQNASLKRWRFYKPLERLTKKRGNTSSPNQARKKTFY
jgi:hypothetical protein